MRFFRTLAFVLLALAAVAAIPGSAWAKEDKNRILVFSKTLRWRHDSIPAGIEALKKLGAENDIEVIATEDAATFTEDNLQTFDAIVFLNTTGNVLDDAQEIAFRRFIQSGGGFVGIHSATATEYDSIWYNGLVGAYLSSHPLNPGVRSGVIEVYDENHPAMKGVPRRWPREEEWYSFRNIAPDLHVLANLDENTYDGGTNGSNHPIVWCHDYDGGRSFYTALGHEAATFADPTFLGHLLGGIRYAIGDGNRDLARATAKQVPSESHFIKTSLIKGLKQPMTLAIAPDGRVFFTELITGDIQVFDPKANAVEFVHHLEVTSKGGTGLIGITLHPQFPQQPFAYVYYTPEAKDDQLAFRLSRFNVVGNKFEPATEKVLLTVPVIANGGSHHGGSMAWDRAGNLYLSTGDTTTPHPAKGYAPLDERPGAEHVELDSQRTAANTDALTGKILRIHPEADGTYTIPSGNLFAPGTAKTRPEIYIMGCRNPYRIAIDPRTDTLYWGEIGPDAGTDSPRGPRGYDEFNQAKKPGNFGWPYFVGNNFAYPRWDYVTEVAGPTQSPEAPENHSPNNTGLVQLPPAQAPFIWYPYAASNEFPLLGQGGRAAMAGEFLVMDRAHASPRALPAHYDGALFVFDWMRNWIMALRFDDQEKYVETERFLAAKGDFRRPIDLAFTRDGVLYVLEYGSVYGANNPDAQLSRIEYNDGPLPPIAEAGIIDTVQLAANQEKTRRVFLTSEQVQTVPLLREAAGAAPFNVRLMAKKPQDASERLPVSYSWSIDEDAGFHANGEEASYTFSAQGTYHVVLTATDSAGASATDRVVVKVGNEPPEVRIETAQNTSFFWNGDRLAYRISVSDREDGAKLSPTKASVTFSPEPSDVPSPGVQVAKVAGPAPLGAEMMAGSDCRACHTLATKVVGPSLVSIAERYKGDAEAPKHLVNKIIQGGAGVWGDTPMPAHPQLPEENVREIVKYILSLNDSRGSERTIEQEGAITFTEQRPDDRYPQYRLVASYTDRGGHGIAPLTSTAELLLKPARLNAAFADAHPGFSRFRDSLSAGGNKAYLLFRDIDFTQLTAVTLYYTATAAGELEARLDSFAGPIIGTGPFAPTAEGEKPRRVRATFSRPISGRHDLYLILRKRDQPNSQLLTPFSVEFHK